MYVISVSSIFLAPYFSNSRFTRFSATLFEKEKVIMEMAENKFEIIHETISKANNTLSVKMLCEILASQDPVIIIVDR